MTEPVTFKGIDTGLKVEREECLVHTPSCVRDAEGQWRRPEVEEINALTRLVEDAEAKVGGRFAPAIWAIVEPQLPAPAGGGVDLRAVARTAIENYCGESIEPAVCFNCGSAAVIAASQFGPVCNSCSFSLIGCEPCAVCGKPLRVGEWGCISRIVEHAPSVQTNTFAAYFDIGLGIEVNNPGDRRAAMRGHVDPHSGATVGQLDYRDKPSKGDLSARNDRIRERQKAEGRG